MYASYFLTASLGLTARHQLLEVLQEQQAPRLPNQQEQQEIKRAQKPSKRKKPAPKKKQSKSSESDEESDDDDTTKDLLAAFSSLSVESSGAAGPPVHFSALAADLVARMSFRKGALKEMEEFPAGLESLPPTWTVCCLSLSVSWV